MPMVRYAGRAMTGRNGPTGEAARCNGGHRDCGTRDCSTRDYGFERWLLSAFVLHLVGLLTIRHLDAGLTRKPTAADLAAEPNTALSFELLEAAQPGSAEPLARRPSAAAGPSQKPVAMAGRRGRHGGLEEPAEVEPATPAAQGARRAAEDQSARRLSLQQLGVGREGRGTVFASALEPSTEVTVESRLRGSLLEGLAAGDRAKGLGLEGAVVRAVTELVRASALPLATRATFQLLADADGVTRSVEVLESGSDAREWQRIAEGLKRALATRRLRMPAQSSGVRFQIRIQSRELLASGAEERLESEVFGSTKRAPGTPPAARISLLPSRPEAVLLHPPQLEGAHWRPWAGFTNNIGSASADLTDMAPRSQRMVTGEIAALQFELPGMCSGAALSAGAAPADCASAIQ